MWGLAWSHRAAGRSGRSPTRERCLLRHGLRPSPDLVQQRALVNLVHYLPLQGRLCRPPASAPDLAEDQAGQEACTGRCSCPAGGTVLGAGAGGAGRCGHLAASLLAG